MKTQIFVHKDEFYVKYANVAKDKVFLDGSSMRNDVLKPEDSDRKFIKVYSIDNFVLYLDEGEYSFIQHNIDKANAIDFGLELEFYVKFNGGAGSYSNYYLDIGNSKMIEDLLYKYPNIFDGGNSEVGIGQAEIQVRDHGFTAAHKLMIAKYLLISSFGKNVSFDPKRYDNMPGSSMHFNISVRGPMNVHEMINRLKPTHSQFIDICGDNNKKRLTGEHETSSHSNFTFGRGDRTASFKWKGNGEKTTYVGEDRRPGSDCNPYSIISYYTDKLVD